MRNRVPYEIRDSAAQDINKACKALKAKEKRFKRELKFKHKKDDWTSVALRARQLNCKSDRGGCVAQALWHHPGQVGDED